MKQEQSKAEQIIDHCLEVDARLKTVKKSLAYDEDNIQGFVNHYGEILEKAIADNWKVHDLATGISRDDFRRNLKWE